MSQGKLQRFDSQFLRDFRSPITVNTKAIAEPVEAVAPPPPPVFREADMEQAREAGKKMGYAEGFESGIAQANTEAHAAARDLAHHMGRIEEHVARLVSQYNALVAQQSAELSELVLMIARKVAGDALDTNAAQAVSGLVERCLPILYRKPRVSIELAPEMADAAGEKLRSQLVRSGFEGEVEFRAIEGMEPSDVRIDWGNGAAQRNTAAIWTEIEALLQQVPLAPTLPADAEPNTTTNTNTNEIIVETGADHG